MTAIQPLAFYNEHDSYAAAWLRNLIAAGHIAPGIVDERDIRDISPDDLRGFTQVHMFAGIGIWSLVLRRAGWPDWRPIWTGSCPCQPFSAAGRGAGVADERHLWPHWFYLISECRPDVITGEQVASKDGLGWNDLVSADLEGAGYAFGAFDLCAAGVTVDWEESDAGQWLQRAIRDCADPIIAAQLRDFADWAGAGNLGTGGKHIRQRQYFVGVDNHDDEGSQGYPGHGDSGAGRAIEVGPVAAASCDGGLADATHRDGWCREPGEEAGTGSHEQWRRGPSGRRGNLGLDDGISVGRTAWRLGNHERHDWQQFGSDGCNDRSHALGLERQSDDWLFCRDGKWRAAESGTFPLAHEDTSRVGRLRAFGNALDAETAFNFIVCVKDILDFGLDLTIDDGDLIG